MGLASSSVPCVAKWRTLKGARLSLDALLAGLSARVDAAAARAVQGRERAHLSLGLGERVERAAVHEDAVRPVGRRVVE
jgi:hypothetical protein